MESAHLNLNSVLLQNGGECLRAYVAVAMEQIAQWHDEQGHNGLWYVMQVVSQLLDPRTSEYTAAFVGRLVSTLITKAGSQLGENLDQILRAILSKMQQAETLSVMQVRSGTLKDLIKYVFEVGRGTDARWEGDVHWKGGVAQEAEEHKGLSE